MGVIVDTCIWIDVERGKLAPADVQQITRSEAVFISPVTIAELTFGAESAKDPAIKQRRIASVERLKRKPTLRIDSETGTIFGRVSSQLKADGRGSDFRIQDLWIASQAIQHGYSLLTRNKKDFHDIPGLDLVVFPESKPHDQKPASSPDDCEPDKE
jgi:predicted nucleic acid-binding protein